MCFPSFWRGFLHAQLVTSQFQTSKSDYLLVDLFRKRLVSCQALSGTGALRLGFEFIKKFFPNGTTVYLPEPTWGNHKLMLQTVGLAGKDYRYYDRSTNSINLNGMLEDLRVS